MSLLLISTGNRLLIEGGFSNADPGGLRLEPAPTGGNWLDPFADEDGYVYRDGRLRFVRQ